MNQWKCAFAVAVLSLPTAESSAMVVDQPRPITHRVTVNIVETALNNGSSPATVFGNAAQRASIEAAVDAIWAQAGIDIEFLDSMVRYNNSFAFQGFNGDLLRPVTDFNLMFSQAELAGGILHPAPSVINIFFVEVVPGFTPRPETWSGALANLGTDGIAQFIGEILLETESGRESVATVIAHEIGHNLGLRHVDNGLPNLMSASQRSSAQLTSEQIEAIFETQFRSDNIVYIPHGGTGFPQLLPPLVAGDYNRDGRVDSADYTMWRDTLGSTGNLAADGNGNQVIDAQDYTIFKNNFGRVAASGGSLPGPVPEPASIFYLAIAAVALFLGRPAGRAGR